MIPGSQQQTSSSLQKLWTHEETVHCRKCSSHHPTPPVPPPFSFLLHHLGTRACNADVVLCACLSPSVIVVDFARCPQKHCSICAPFHRNCLRILMDGVDGASALSRSGTSWESSWMGWMEPLLCPGQAAAAAAQKDTVCRTQPAEAGILSDHPLLLYLSVLLFHRQSLAFISLLRQAKQGRYNVL